MIYKAKSSAYAGGFVFKTKGRFILKKRIFDVIQIGQESDIISRLFDIFISAVIILNILTMFLETFDELAKFMGIFTVIESVTVIIFCIEYILRIWTADLLYPEEKGISARIRFLLSYDGIVDLLTILPFFFLSGFIVFRMLRVVRIFHLFRINAKYDSFSIITTVLYEKKNQILSSVFIIFILMLASSLGMYSVEHEIQPEIFENAFSGMWWSMATLLTVGYGDIYPVTVIGRIMAIITAFLGVGVVAIPTGIISAGFVEQYTKKSASESKIRDIDEIGEILADSESGFIGMTIGEIQEIYNMRVYVVMRDDITIIGANNIEIRENDILVASSENIVRNNGGKRE